MHTYTDIHTHTYPHITTYPSNHPSKYLSASLLKYERGCSASEFSLTFHVCVYLCIFVCIFVCMYRSFFSPMG